MTDKQDPAPAPAPAPAQPPPPTPPAPSDTSKGKFHFLIVSSETDDQGPKWTTADDMSAFVDQLYQALIEAKAGWCYVIVDGERWVLSSPSQFFQLQKPDGNIVRVEPDAQVGFSQDGMFAALVSPTTR